MYNNTCNKIINLYCYVLKILPQNTRVRWYFLSADLKSVLFPCNSIMFEGKLLNIFKAELVTPIELRKFTYGKWNWFLLLVLKSSNDELAVKLSKFLQIQTLLTIWRLTTTLVVVLHR
jgi:hypothetical protein